MLYDFYTHVAQTVSDEIEEIRWIDLDRGQLEYPEHFESLVLPCVLINISDGVSWQGLTNGGQIGEVDVSLKTVIRLPEPIYHNARFNNNNDALSIENDVHKAAHVKLRWQRVGTKAYPASKTYFVVEHFYKTSLDYKLGEPVRKKLSELQKEFDFQIKPK